VLEGDFDRMVNFEMDNANKDSYFDKDYPDMALSGGLNASFPVLESLVLRNMVLES
jgi:hypothetical protein